MPSGYYNYPALGLAGVARPASGRAASRAAAILDVCVPSTFGFSAAGGWVPFPAAAGGELTTRFGRFALRWRV